MSLLFEAVCIKDGKVPDLGPHNRRMNRSRAELLGREDPLDLGSYITVPGDFKTGKVKCRIFYSETVEKVEYEHYQQKNIRSLRLVENDEIDYSHKYADKNPLLKLLEIKGNCDDILIVKNGLITDTSFSNIILFNGQEWHTPAQPLLNGTKREHLLSKHLIIGKDIKPTDLRRYLQVSLINAMLNPGEILFEAAFIKA